MQSTARIRASADPNSSDGRWRVSSGPDEHEVAAAYAQHARAVLSLATRIVGDGHLAQDITQEVFVALSVQGGRYEPALGSLRGWLLTIAHHKSVDQVRWQVRRTSRDVGDDALVWLPDPSRDPETSACAADDSRRLLLALGDLPVPERLALTLAYFEGLTQVQIAERTRVPLGTVKSRTRQGLKRLNDAIADSASAGGD